MERQEINSETTELSAFEWEFLEVRVGKMMGSDIGYVARELQIPIKEARSIDKRISSKLARAYLMKLPPFDFMD